MVAVEPSRTAGVALWRQVQHDLRRRIDAEEFVDAFPGEKVLAHEYGVSRQTMRQAVRPLRESGVVTAQRGRSPRVRTDVTNNHRGAVHPVRSSGMRSTAHRARRAPRPDAARFLGLGRPRGCPPGMRFAGERRWP